MYNSLILFLDRYGNKKIVFFGLFVIVLFNVLFLPKFPLLFEIDTIDTNLILDLKFSYSCEIIQSIFNELGNKRRKIYLLSALFVDLPYTIIYGFTYSFMVYLLLKINDLHKYFFLAVTPFLISMFDVLENFSIIYMLSVYPKTIKIICNMSSLFTSLKWIFAIATISITLFLVGKFLVTKYIYRK